MVVQLSWNMKLKKNKILEDSEQDDEISHWTIMVWTLLAHAPCYLKGVILDIDYLNGEI